jgi:hypothetical protein
MTLLSYTEFLAETYYGVSLKDAKVRLLKAAAKDTMALDEREMFFILMENGYQDLILEAIDTGNYDMINEGLINESILDKAKERLANLKDAVKDKGKAALDKMSDGSKNLLKIGGNILKPIKAIIDKMGSLIKSAWDKAKSLTKAAVEKALPKLTARLKSLVKDGDKKKSLMQEANDLAATASAGVKLVTGGFTKLIADAAGKAAQTDEAVYINMLESAMVYAVAEMIDEGYGTANLVKEAKEFNYTLLESDDQSGGLKIPFVSAIMDKIAHMPPFKWFHAIEGKVAEIANNSLARLSAIVAKLDGPGPFNFEIIGGLIGIAAGYAAEQLAKGAVFGANGATILGFAIPGAGILYKVIKYTGYALAIYGVIKEVVGQGDKEKENSDDFEDTKSSKDKKEIEKK